MSYQIYQRDENDKATISISGVVEDGTDNVTVAISGDIMDQDIVTIVDNAFTYTKTLGTGLYDILRYCQVGKRLQSMRRSVSVMYGLRQDSQT